MILLQNIDLKQLQKKKKNYDWKRPKQCPNCLCETIWGHGYVQRYFGNITVYIKRWICSVCRLVLLIRPKGFWRRFQTSINDIFNCLKFRLTNSRSPPMWPSTVTRQRGGYWLRCFQKYIDTHKLILKVNFLETIKYFQQKDLPFF